MKWTPEEREARIKYEKSVYDAVKKSVAKNMSEEQKDRLFRVFQNDPIAFEILKDNPNYKEIRDRTIAGDLLGDALAYEEKPTKEGFIREKFISKYIEDWQKIETSERYVNNALKGIKTRFPNEYDIILSTLEESEMDPNQMRYLGSGTYQYKIFILSFTNSPVQLDLRVIEE